MQNIHRLLFLGLFFLLCLDNYAQTPEWFHQRLILNSAYFFLDNVAIKNRYIYREQADTIILNVAKPTDLQRVIDNELQDKVYAVQIMYGANPDLPQIFSLLTRFPNLAYLKIQDPEILNPDGKSYKLSANIRLLQQLKAVEFASTNRLEMADALTKLTPLKQLRMLFITGYIYQLPKTIINLKQINTVAFSPRNIGSNDFSNVHWVMAYINGGYKRWHGLPYIKGDDGEKDLLKLTKIKSLRTLDLSLGNITDTTLITKFRQITNLRLNLALIQTGHLLENISKLNNLQELLLNLSSDSGVMLSLDKLQNLKKLTTLNINLDLRHIEPGYDIEHFDALGNLTNLQSISLYGLYMDTIPDIFKSLTHLKNVTISSFELKELPLSIFNLPLLEFLQVRSGSITSLPDAEYYNCNNLKTLILNQERLSTLPRAITSLHNLAVIDVSNNYIRKAPDGWDQLNNLKQVDFSYNLLETFPGGLQNNHHVEKINLYKNFISTIPDISGEGFALKYLALGDNQLVKITEDIGKYTNLETFSTFKAGLQSIPSSLGNCKKLKYLFLSQSIIDHAVLPNGLKNAKDLEYLYLGHNPMLDKQSVYNVLFGTPRKSLTADLSFNEISRLPDTSAWGTTAFNDLNLSNNKLSALPAAFANAQIKTAHIGNNLFPGDKAVYNVPVESKADLKIIFDEMGKPLPDFAISNKEYAASLAKYANAFFDSELTGKTIEFAQKSVTAETVTYNSHIDFKKIGIARFKSGDYAGAIKDIDSDDYWERQKGFQRDDEEIAYLAKSYLALNRFDEAAATFAKIHIVYDYVQALITCKKSGNEKLYHQLSDSASTYFEGDLAFNAKHDLYNTRLPYIVPKDQYPIRTILDYASFLLAAGKPANALKILAKKEQSYSDFNMAPARALLASAANYLTGKQSFEEAEQTLKHVVAEHGRQNPYVDYYRLVSFDDWLPYSGLSALQQENMLVLQNIAVVK